MWTVLDQWRRNWQVPNVVVALMEHGYICSDIAYAHESIREDLDMLSIKKISCGGSH